MSTDPTANPNPEDAATPRPSDPTAPSFGSPSQPTAPQPTSPPPPPPAPPPGQPYPGYGQQGGYPSPAPPPAYGGGVYAGGQEHPQGTMILVLGILSIVICQILGPFAWIMGRKALTEIDSSGRAYTNRSMVNAGMICGIIGTVLLILALAYFVIVVVFLGVAASSGNLR
jgi:hypothetical protein